MKRQRQNTKLSMLDVDSLPLRQNEIARLYNVEVQPDSLPNTGAGPLEFTIPANQVAHFRPEETELTLQAKIVRADGTDMDDSEVVVPCNALFSMIFGECDVYLIN